MTLKTIIYAGIAADLSVAIDKGTRRHRLDKEADILLATGTGASQADQMFTDTRTLGGSANEDLDLAASLVDALGQTLTFVKIKAILIIAAAANVGDIQVKPAAANGFLGPFANASDRLDVPAGGRILLTAPVTGWTVTAGTGDLLNIANSAAGNAIYDIILIGTSA